MKIGDLVTYCGNGYMYIITKIYPTSEVDILSLSTGRISTLPSNWLTKVETDNFCPLHSSTNSL